jgi:hypothetical protein
VENMSISPTAVPSSVPTLTPIPYQEIMIEKVSKISEDISNINYMMYVLCVIVAAFMIYLLIHHMLNRR